MSSMCNMCNIFKRIAEYNHSSTTEVLVVSLLVAVNSICSKYEGEEYLLKTLVRKYLWNLFFHSLILHTRSPMLKAPYFLMPQHLSMCVLEEKVFFQNYLFTKKQKLTRKNIEQCPIWCIADLSRGNVKDKNSVKEKILNLMIKLVSPKE